MSSSSTPRLTTASTTCASWCRASTPPPRTSRRKVFIIDEVQRIKEGWDVLLKTLEEPPDGVLFIFCTTDPSQIRPAVVSRLQRFTFRPLTDDADRGKLRRILEAEGRPQSRDAIDLIARLAAGGMRDAESMLDQVLASGVGCGIDADVGAGLLGLAEEEAVDRFIDALAGGDALAGIEVLDELEARGPGPGRLRRPGRRRACANDWWRRSVAGTDSDLQPSGSPAPRAG